MKKTIISRIIKITTEYWTTIRCIVLFDGPIHIFVLYSYNINEHTRNAFTLTDTGTRGKTTIRFSEQEKIRTHYRLFAITIACYRAQKNRNYDLANVTTNIWMKKKLCPRKNTTTFKRLTVTKSFAVYTILTYTYI